MIKVAIIGCGRISYKHVQAITDNSGHAELVAVCDVSEERAKEKAKQYEDIMNNSVPKIYTDYKVMLVNELIDLVAICTESGYHAEIALYCMNQGKHIIVEKPMALSTQDAIEMISAAQRNKVKLCVSHQNRFNPTVQRLRKALEDGRFGRIIAGNARILWNRGQDYYSQAPWRGTYELDGGCLMNQCIHNIDLLQWTLGSKAQWVNGVVENNMHPYIEAEDYGSIQIRFEEGAIGNVEGTVCVYPTNLEETLTIIGEKGIVSLGGLAVNTIESWRFADGLDSEAEVMAECNTDIDSVYGNGHTPLYKDVIDAVMYDREPYVNGHEGIRALEIVLAAYKSNEVGNRVYLPLGDVSTIDFK